MSRLREIITSTDAELRNQPLERFCASAGTQALLAECEALEALRRASGSLYERVRALFFLSAIHRFHLPGKPGVAAEGRVPFAGYHHLLQRRFEEAIRSFHEAQQSQGPSDAVSSALAAAYKGLAFQTLADQVRRSVRSVRGNQWMFRTGHPADDPLRLRPELLRRDPESGLYPLLSEATPVRMDLSHSGWSDIFFLGMDYPEGARVLNISIDLAVRGLAQSEPRPPVEACLRVIDEPVLRLTSVDLGATADITTLAEVFDFARDYLGLLKAAIIAAGLVPAGLEGSGQSLAELLLVITGLPGHGLEITSKVNDIPKGSRLAVSTNLLASLISVCMRATGQIRWLTGGLEESDRRQVAARAILGEWLGGSGGGWQDSGGVWPGIKLIEGVAAQEGDVEHGISRGCLLPRHRVFPLDEVTAETRRKLQESLVLVHGGMAQDVGPILEMVTEKYLLRCEAEWQGRQQAIALLDEIIACLRTGDIRGIGERTQRNFDGPIQTIIPWAANHYTRRLIERAREEFGEQFWGFWMLGGMAGGGMGFLFAPEVKAAAQERMAVIMREVKRTMDRAVPFAMEPVVYDFEINERGTWATLATGAAALLPASYYTLRLPEMLRRDTRTLTPAQRGELETFGAACRQDPALAGMVQTVFDRMLPTDEAKAGGGARSLEALLREFGFDRVQHEKIRADLRSGRIGLAQNRLAVSSTIEDVSREEVTDTRGGLAPRLRELGEDALRAGAVAVVSLAGGVGSRWTRGAGVVKALNPFAQFGGRHRNFVEVHLAKSRRSGKISGRAVPHVLTTSYMTNSPMVDYLAASGNYGYDGPLYVSPGRIVGLRLVPMARDLRFAWEEMPQQVLDVQKQKMRESLHAALIQWAVSAGEGSDYTDNLPEQCLHPVGHWYEIPNLLRNGTLARVLDENPGVRHLLLHNIDTLGASLAPELLGLHIDSGAAITTEVIAREVEDRGGGLARINGNVRLIEGMALPDERIEFALSYYNSNTMWIDVARMLAAFGLTREDLGNAEKTTAAIRHMAGRMPTYVTLKDVKKRWGKGQEDIFPVMQFEKLWGDMTALPDLACAYAVVPRMRGQQLKDVAQFDGWLRDGSAAYVDALCDW
ncbi:MAG: UTP--glucose-1-phosphate uridylyltransferase [Bryobacterales bacterium]|nr:UTP--glucose-1-phosphate uridylyltransferase [Bryobacterales bacterium]